MGKTEERENIMKIILFIFFISISNTKTKKNVGGLFRFVLPLLRSGSKAVGKEMLNSSINVLSDIQSNDSSLKESLKRRGKESIDALKRKAFEKMTGSGAVVKQKKKKTNEKIQSSLKASKPKTVKQKAPAKEKTAPNKKKKKSVATKKPSSSSSTSSSKSSKKKDLKTFSYF